MVFVGFSTPKRWNPLSWAIRAATRSAASHAWLLVEDPLFKLRLVLEAHSTGFRLVTFARFAHRNRIIAIVVPGHPLDRGLPRAGRWLGEHFDTIGLLGMAWVVLRRLLHLTPRHNPFHRARSLFCSEAVVRAMKAAAYPGAEDLRDEDATPADVLEFLRSSGSEVLSHRELNLRRRPGPRRRKAVPGAIAGAPPERAQDRAA